MPAELPVSFKLALELAFSMLSFTRLTLNPYLSVLTLTRSTLNPYLSVMLTFYSFDS